MQSSYNPTLFQQAHKDIPYLACEGERWDIFWEAWALSQYDERLTR